MVFWIISLKAIFCSHYATCHSNNMCRLGQCSVFLYSLRDSDPIIISTISEMGKVSWKLTTTPSLVGFKTLSISLWLTLQFLLFLRPFLQPSILPSNWRVFPLSLSCHQPCFWEKTIEKTHHRLRQQTIPLVSQNNSILSGLFSKYSLLWRPDEIR